MNRLQSIVGIFLLFQQAPASVHQMLQYLGMSISRHRAIQLLAAFNAKAIERARQQAADPTRVKVLIYDNVDIYLRVAQQSVTKSNVLLNLTMRTLFVLPEAFSQTTVTSTSLAPLRAPRTLTMDEIVNADSAAYFNRLCRVQVAEQLLLAVQRKSNAPAKQQTLQHIRHYLRALRDAHAMDCLPAEAAKTTPLPLLDVNEGTVEGVTEFLEDSAAVLGIVSREQEATNADAGAAASSATMNDAVSDTPSWTSACSEDEDDPVRLTNALGSDGVMLVVGDLKSHRLVGSAQANRASDKTREGKLEYFHSLSAPWHLLLNWVYAIFKVHFPTEELGQEVSLERYRDALQRSKTLLREADPSFTEAWALMEDVFAGRMQHAFQSELDAAMRRHDDVGANARLFMRDAALAFDFKDAVAFGDVGRLHSVSKHLVLGFAGAGRLQYAEALMDDIWSKKQLASATYRSLNAARLINRRGTVDGFIGADLYQEHLNREIQRINTAASREGLVDRLVDVFSGAAELARSARLGHPQMFQCSGASGERRKVRDLDQDLCCLLAEKDNLFAEQEQRKSGQPLTKPRKQRHHPPNVPPAEELTKTDVPSGSSRARDVLRRGHHYLASRLLERNDSDDQGSEKSSEGEEVFDAPDDDLASAALDAIRMRDQDRRQMDIEMEDG
ncbi:hypothetical protein OC835_007220 [Tilletia horrida]|nr:hypothetical protein OC835_007220 [Tilletia horrida]